MATKKDTTNGKGTAVVPFEQRSIRYVPLGESEEIEVSAGMVKSMLATKSRSGREPSYADITMFMMLCKSRGLNPFVRDAYLIGYDNNDGTTSWTLITAIQALRKRAEAHPQFDGCRRGVIVRRGEEIVELEGAFYQEQDVLLGGWSECHRKDKGVPFRETVKLSVYDTNMSRWKKDPGGMIAKVAEAASLRRAFPSDLAGLYVYEEFHGNESRPQVTARKTGGMEGLREALGDANAKSGTPPAPQEQVAQEPVEPTEQELVASGINEPKGDKLFDRAPSAQDD